MVAVAISGVLFVVGAIFLVIFVIMNVHREANLAPVTREQSTKQAILSDSNKKDTCNAITVH